jgi:DNA-binding SARP family transcriptional activator
MSHETIPAVRLSLLRGFELRAGREVVPLISSAQRLVAFLALQARPLGRSYVAEILWPETTSIRANANLRSSLWRAQRSCGRLINVSSQCLTLARGVVVDFHVATAHAHRLLTGEHPCEEDIGADLRADLSADLLLDWYDDWVLVERERYHQLRLHALEVICARLTTAGRYGEAIDAGLAAIRAEPLRESAHRALIEAYLAEGNRWEAVRQYEQCRRLLLDELGLEPSAALLDLVPAASSPVSTPAGAPHRRRRAYRPARSQA